MPKLGGAIGLDNPVGVWCALGLELCMLDWGGGKGVEVLCMLYWYGALGLDEKCCWSGMVHLGWMRSACWSGMIGMAEEMHKE